MAVLRIYAGSSSSSLTELPSPTDIDTSYEQIWSENTGRAQSGSNQASMIGDSKAEKITYNIKWGVISPTQLGNIRSLLTRGFFYFAVGTSAPSSASQFYRSEITAKPFQAGSEVMYKDVAVSVIQK